LGILSLFVVFLSFHGAAGQFSVCRLV
jgi:hypothetical protein